MSCAWPPDHVLMRYAGALGTRRTRKRPHVGEEAVEGPLLRRSFHTPVTDPPAQLPPKGSHDGWK